MIKQIDNKNPSFINIVENSFIKNGVTIYSEDSQIIDSESEGKIGGLIITNRGLGFAGGKTQDSSSTKIKNISGTKATCIYYFDAYNFTFKVILLATREIIMKGRIKYDFDKEITQMLHELTKK